MARFTVVGFVEKSGLMLELAHEYGGDLLDFMKKFFVKLIS
jgi:hypothetical protein